MKFQLKDQHIRLLARANVGWQDCETGAPEIDPKRPYGNSSVAQDVAEILGIEPSCRNDNNGDRWLSDDQEAACLAIHRETEQALEIVLQHGRTPGIYSKAQFGWKWEPVEVTEP